jgi:hypothetical protein
MLALVIGSAAVFPIHRADAVIGLATLNPVMAVLGLATTAAGEGLFWCGFTCDPVSDSESDVLIGAGILGDIAGIVVLDGNAGQDVAFSAIASQSVATGLGLSKAELLAYNRELDAINLIRENVASQLPRDSKGSVQDAAALWEKYRADLSPAAFSAAQKISQAAAKSLNDRLRTR